jgi:hypothetical protein
MLRPSGPWDLPVERRAVPGGGVRGYNVLPRGVEHRRACAEEVADESSPLDAHFWA